jgi:hypothetical protein
MVSSSVSRSFSTLLGGAACLLAWIGNGELLRPEDSHTESRPTRSPNVLMISLDTVRADHCSLYGYPKPTTPNLERLAEEGVVFEQAYAPTGITGPSHSTSSPAGS